MLEVTIYSPNGIEFKGQFNHIQVVDQKNGSFGILSNHVPLISIIKSGYLNFDGDEKLSISLKGGVLKLKDNVVSVTAEIIAKGKDPEESETLLKELIKKRKNENRERNIELALAEKELKKQISKTGAGKL